MAVARGVASQEAKRGNGVPASTREREHAGVLGPVRWRSRKTVFVNPMSDLFQDAVPDEYICAVAKVMEMADWHTFQVLTKRSERMSELLKTELR
jgi:protein gp37